MTKKIIINSNLTESRVALIEEGHLAELKIDRLSQRSIVGNIYKGKVKRVIKGMQSAFVDIGLDRAAFLFGGDVFDPKELEKRFSEGAIDDLSEIKTFNNKVPIEKLIKQNQELIVQVAKDPIGTKGARLSMFISLPGRYLVLIPNFSHIGVSRRITNGKERDRLTKLVSQSRKSNHGFIVRTAAEGLDAKLIKQDIHDLEKLWDGIGQHTPKSKAPATLYSDSSVYLKVVRDLFDDEVESIIVDDRKVFEEIRQFLTHTIPGAVKKLKPHKSLQPIFDTYNIESQIAQALSREVKLPSGGYLVIDHTEALTAFDVNTGSYVGKKSAKETILRTNLEAAPEVVRQLRLRNIGGIIVIDFIDMTDPVDREKVFLALEKALTADKARTNVLRISELGLVQMTRKRTSESLSRQLTSPCSHCDGHGRVNSLSTDALEILREIQRKASQAKRKKFTLKVRPELKEWLTHQEAGNLDALSKQFGLKVNFVNLPADHTSTKTYEFVDG